MTCAVIIMVLELNSTPKNIQKSALKILKVQCGTMRKKKLCMNSLNVYILSRRGCLEF